MKEIKTDSFIIRVHSPNITKENTSRQMRQIQKSAEKLLKSKEKTTRERKAG